MRLTPAALSLTLALVFNVTTFAAFTDVTASTGIDYLHGSGKGVIDSAGACALDLDGDGWTDLIFARATEPCLVFINNHDGTFREEGAARGLATVTGIGGIAAGDLRNSGHPDIVMTPTNGSRYFLFINDGTGHFTEQAVSRGSDCSVTIENHRTYSVSLVDYDRDGYLDIYTCETPIPKTTEDDKHSVLLHNLGSASPGYFDNVTVAAGVKQPRTDIQHHGFTGLWADFDGDGWPDLSLLSDYKTSQLWWNNGNGAFTETGVASGVDKDENGMGGAVADFDGDGNLDFYACSIFDRVLSATKGIALGNKLYRNLGNRHFEEVAGSAGVAKGGWAWGAAFLDADNRGLPDLLVTNGTDFTKGSDPRVTPYTDAVTDPTTFFQNQGDGTFVNATTDYGFHDVDLGRSVVVLDYDNDGDEDVVITNAFGHPVFYRNDAAGKGGHWLNLRFQGTDSNRDGYGALVRATVGTRVLTSLYAPTNAFMAQREPQLHLGLGSGSTTVTRLEVVWPRGTVQVLENVTVDQTLSLVEPSSSEVAPYFSVQPQPVTANKDSSATLAATAQGNPAPVYVWYKDGVALAGATSSSLTLKRIHPLDAGIYRVDAINPAGRVSSTEVTVSVTADLASKSVARWWNEALLDGIRKDIPNPPVHARNLFHLSAALWDAYWPYQEEGWTQAKPLYTREDVTPEAWQGNRERAQAEAMSHAAFRVISSRFKKSPGAARTLFGARWLLQQMGFDPDDETRTGTSPAAVGNRIGDAVLAQTTNDGANDANGYVDTTGYTPVNEPLIVDLPGATMKDPNHWQPLALKFSVSQNGIPLGSGPQKFVGVNALVTTPFALAKPTGTTFSLDPGAPPQLGSGPDDELKRQVVEVIALSAQLDPADGVSVDISPGSTLNNPLGSNGGTGHALNPYSGTPYTSNVVKRADYGRVLAEFWADGPNSETPPGHWNVLFNEVSAHPQFERRFMGTGPVLDRLEWDVRGYLALNGAVHDAACLAWGVKHLYDSARPISLIRYLGGLGQSSDPSGPSYHVSGLPLVPGLIEVVTTESSAPGQRHAALAGSVGKVALRGWKGSPVDPTHQVGGVDWLLAENWVPYQMNTFVTPAFPAYMSGHSTFSRSAAEVLTLLTGSPYFPGGLAEYAFPANTFLTFERGPSAPITLQWATYYDAADQAGRSRLWGGIHIEADDFTGRRLGSQVGLEAFLAAQHQRQASGTASGLVNLSSRGQAGADGDVMIAGFVTEGPASAQTLVRCVGPTLEAFGLPALSCDADPRISLYQQGVTTPLLENNDWASSNADGISSATSTLGAFALPSGSHDAAAVTELQAGVYSVVCGSSAPLSHGTQLVEVYGMNLVNLSTRGKVSGDQSPLIAGFSIRGNEPVVMLIRGIGPALTSFGVSGVLEHPRVRVFRQGENGAAAVLIAENNGWSEATSPSLVAGAGRHAGAFALSNGSADAALVLELLPGNYTAVLEDSAGGSGVGLVEIYHVK